MKLSKLFIISMLPLALLVGCAGPQISTPPKQIIIKDPVPQIDQTAATIKTATDNIASSVKIIEEQTRQIDIKAPNVKDNTDTIRQMDAKITAQAEVIANQGAILAEVKKQVEDLKTTIQNEPKRTEAAIRAAVTPLQATISSLSKDNAKLTKQANANMVFLNGLMALLAFLAVLTMAFGTYIVISSPVQKLKGMGLIAAGAMGIASAIAIMLQSVIIGIIGASIVGLLVLIIVVMIIKEQLKVNKELVQTTQVTKNALKVADPVAHDAIFIPEDKKNVSKIQSKLTSDVVADIKAKEP